MGLEAQREYLVRMRERYVIATRREQSRLLDEAVAMTGRHPAAPLLHYCWLSAAQAVAFAAGDEGRWSQTMSRMWRARAIIVFLMLLAAPQKAAADWELSLFLGQAYPIFDDRLVIRLPGVPAVPGLDVEIHGTPQIRIDGGLVFGGGLAWHLGPFGLEGRLDAVNVGFDVTGARYDFGATAPPFAGATGSITIGDGRFDADRLHLLSLNARLRTPGPIALVASGGLSYLPSFDVTGSAPVQFQFQGLPVVPPAQPQLRLRVAPGQSAHRFGVNGGAGLRIGGRIGLFGEARIFYFRSYELHAVLEDAPALVDDLLGEFDIVRFEPVIVNAVVGLAIRF